MTSNPLSTLSDKIRGRVLTSEPIRNYTTYRTGGEAEILVLPDDEADAAAVVTCARRAGIPLTVLGAGSNVIVTDAGVEGIVLIMREWPAHVDFIGERRIRVGAGVMIDALLDEAASCNLAGLEELAGIPGTVGGALVMNAGTRTFEIAERLTSVAVLTRSGRRRVFDAGGLDFGYRRSSFQESEWIVVEAEFLLESGESAFLAARMDELRRFRRERYPYDLPSAGSVFRHPPGQKAGYLIEQAGCKGMRCGGAVVSTLHANFIVNEGGATSSDIMNLIGTVRRRVYEKFGVMLVLEQIPVGIPRE
jgi:UDP-N-acetylmuramate dehydrogenase